MIFQRPLRGLSGFGLSVTYSPEAQASLVTGEGLAVAQAVTPLKLWLIQNWKVAALGGGTLGLALLAHKVITRNRKRRR